MGICQILVDRKGDVTAKNSLGMTPLHVACNNGHESVVAYLISKDAEVNEPDKNGNTPLHIAARTGFKGIVKALITAGARPTSNRAGKTPDQLTEGEIASMIQAVA
jgi:cytohesin